MPRYLFTIGTGAQSTPKTTSILPNTAAAQKLALAIYADLARDIVIHLAGGSGWQVSVSDETGRPFYRISVVAESLE
jgi:hypothetical protein